MTLAHTSQQRVARDRGGDATSPAASMSSGVVQANVADGVVPAVIAAGLVTCPIVNTRVRPRCRQAPQFGFVEDLLPMYPVVLHGSEVVSQHWDMGSPATGSPATNKPRGSVHILCK